MYAVNLTVFLLLMLAAANGQVDPLESFANASSEAEARQLLEATPSIATPENLKSLSARSSKLRGGAAVRLDRWIVLAADRLGDLDLRSQYRSILSLSLAVNGDFEQALSMSRQAIDLAKGSSSKRELARASLVACDQLRRLGDTASARPACVEGLEAARQAKDEVMEARLQNSLGNLYLATDNYRLAYQAFQSALALAEAKGERLGVAFVKNNLGNLFENQGNHEEAVRYYEESLEIKKKSGSRSDQLSTLLNLALAHYHAGQLALAEKLFRDLIQIAEENKDLPRRLIGVENLAVVERAQGKHESALRHIEEALTIAAPIDMAELQAITAELLVDLHRPADALVHAKEAVAAAERNEQRSAAARAYYVLGAAFYELKNPGAAEDAFRKAVQLVEEIRADLYGGEEDREGFLEKQIAPYRGLFSVLLEGNRTDEAFVVAEQAKARVLLDVLRGGKLEIDKGLTADERAKDEQLRRRLAELNLLVLRQRGTPGAEAANAALRQARLEYRALQSAFYAAHPDLRLQRSETTPATGAQIAEVLPNRQTAAIEFVEVESSIYAIVVRGRTPGVEIFRLDSKAAAVAEKVRRFASQIASRDLAFQPLALELYRILLAPADKVLAGVKTLAIVPSGVLWQLPFQALQPTPGHYLIESRAIFYVPSLTVLREIILRDRPAPGRTLLAMGNPQFAAGSGTPARLANAEREVRDVAALYGADNSEVFVSDRAGEATFKREAPAFSVVHLATHGVLDSGNPMYSHVLLTPGGEEDGLLEAWEILKLDLHTEIVVLSACEMAAGRAGSGEGLIGMSWALFVAGSPATIASLWKVDSASTSVMMVALHRGLLRHGREPSFPKAEALRQAAVETMKNESYRHPFYWAGFVLIGQGL